MIARFIFMLCVLWAMVVALLSHNTNWSHVPAGKVLEFYLVAAGPFLLWQGAGVIARFVILGGLRTRR